MARAISDEYEILIETPFVVPLVLRGDNAYLGEIDITPLIKSLDVNVRAPFPLDGPTTAVLYIDVRRITVRRCDGDSPTEG